MLGPVRSVCIYQRFKIKSFVSKYTFSLYSPNLKITYLSIDLQKLFELRCKPSVAAHASHHQSLALNWFDAEDNNGRDNNTLLSRMRKPLRYFSGYSNYDSDDDQDYVLHHEVVTLRSVKLPIVEQLPKSITWIFTNRHVLFLFSY